MFRAAQRRPEVAGPIDPRPGFWPPPGTSRATGVVARPSNGNGGGNGHSQPDGFAAVIASLGTRAAPGDVRYLAPWGELDPIPRVVIRTYPFPTRWWRAIGPQTAAARATAPVAPAVIRIDPVPDEPARVTIPIETSTAARTPATVATASAPGITGMTFAATSGAAPPLREMPAARAIDRGADEVDPRRSPQRRRSLIGRLALLAVGLVISLIAVESASRRRS